MAEPLVNRIRGVMQLLLIWAMLLGWIATEEPIEIIRLKNDLIRDLDALSDSRLMLEKRYNSESWLTLRSNFRDQAYESIKQCLSEAYLESEIVSIAPVSECLESVATTLTLADEVVNHITPLQTDLPLEDFKSTLAIAKRRHAILKWHSERLNLGPNATFDDVAREARPKISVPGTQHTIPMDKAAVLSIPGLSFLFLYLSSLIRTLRESTSRDNLNTACQWLFLHPGWMGPVLGLLWFTAPLVAWFAAGSVMFKSQAVNSVGQFEIYFLPVLLLSWLMCCLGALRLRISTRTLKAELDEELRTYQLRVDRLIPAPSNRSKAA